MILDTTPYAAKKYAEINGHRMAYIDEGEAEAIVFQHGNPTSSYLWRSLMPHCEGLHFLQKTARTRSAPNWRILLAGCARQRLPMEDKWHENLG